MQPAAVIIVPLFIVAQLCRYWCSNHCWKQIECMKLPVQLYTQFIQPVLRYTRVILLYARIMFHVDVTK